MTAPTLDFRRDEAGKLFLAGLPLSGGGDFQVDALLDQGELSLVSDQLTWTDAQRSTPRLVLRDVSIRLRTRDARHRLDIAFTPPEAMGAAVTGRMNWIGRRFAEWEQWQLTSSLKTAKVDFAVLGLEERDSGDVARRLGDEATFQMLAKRNIQTLAKYRFNRIVTCDPHSFHVLKNEYGAFDGNYLVQHHSTYMAEIIQAGALNLGQHKGNSVTYHDPCYLGRYNGEYEAPREVLRALGIEVKEMQRSGFRSRCCGGGGGAPITDIPGKQRIPDMRMDDIRETGAELVAVGCPQCTAMLEGVVEPRPLIKDIAELVADALLEDAAPNKPATPAKREPAEAH